MAGRKRRSLFGPSVGFDSEGNPVSKQLKTPPKGEGAGSQAGKKIRKPRRKKRR